MSTNYTGNISFTNGTNITIDTTYINDIYSGSNTFTAGNIWINDTTSILPSITIYPSYPAQPYQYTPQPIAPDGYFDFNNLFPQKKETEILVDELRSSIFADLDRCIEALENNEELEQNYNELVAKAEMINEMLTMASEMIKERVEKLKAQKEKVFLDG